MSVGVFTDKKRRPTDAEILEAIGPRWAIWQEFSDWVRATYPAEEDFHFMYGKNYGWALRFRIKGKLLVNLYPAAGRFTAQVNLSAEAVEQAQRMSLGQSAQQAIAQAHPYPEGRWTFIPVESEGDMRDIQQLLALRVNTRRIWKQPTTEP